MSDSILKRGLIIFAIATTAACFFSSCVSSQKKLQRRIERHGIKESIGFVVGKYPEYFETMDTVIRDTIEIHDSIIVPGVAIDTHLRDSVNFWVHNSDSLRVVIDKISGRAAVTVPPRVVEVTDTIIIETHVEPIPCPDVEVLRVGNDSDSDWYWYGFAFLAGVFVPILVGRVRTTRG